MVHALPLEQQNPRAPKCPLSAIGIGVSDSPCQKQLASAHWQEYVLQLDISVHDVVVVTNHTALSTTAKAWKASNSSKQFFCTLSKCSKRSAPLLSSKRSPPLLSSISMWMPPHPLKVHLQPMAAHPPHSSASPKQTLDMSLLPHVEEKLV